MSNKNRPAPGIGSGGANNTSRLRRAAQAGSMTELQLGKGLVFDRHGRLKVDAPAIRDGVIGPRGAQGPGGVLGADGSPGLNGQPGIDGAPGSPGMSGPQGEPGGTGAAGAQGDQGAQGPQGDQGEQGATGPQGAIGPSIAAAQDLGIATTIDSDIVSDSSSDWAETDANALSWNATFEQFVVAGSDSLAAARDSTDAKTIILARGLWLVTFHLLVEENANSDFAVAFKTVVGTGATAAYEVADLFRSAGNSSTWVSGAMSHHQDRDFAYSGQFLVGSSALEVVGNTTLGKDIITADTTWVVNDSSSLVGLELPTPATLRNASGATEVVTITSHGHFESNYSEFELDYSLYNSIDDNIIYDETPNSPVLLQHVFPDVPFSDDPTNPIYARLDWPGGPYVETVRCVRQGTNFDPPFGPHYLERFLEVERDPDNLGFFLDGASTITRISTLDVVRGSSPITGAAGDAITYNSNEEVPMNMRCQMTCESAGVAQMEGRVTFLRLDRLG